MPPSDEELIRRIARGGREAFDLLYRRHRRGVRALIGRMIHDAGVAEDLTQETFFRVWTRADSWCGRGPFRAWLFRIASNLSLNHLRSLRRNPEQPLSGSGPLDREEAEAAVERRLESDLPGPDVLCERAELLDTIRRLIRELPEDKREVFALVHERDLSVPEASEILGIPAGTVKSRLHYGRRRLRQELMRRFEEAP